MGLDGSADKDRVCARLAAGVLFGLRFRPERNSVERRVQIEPDVLISYPLSYFVVARSAHGFWTSRGREQPVQSTDDESPEY